MSFEESRDKLKKDLEKKYSNVLNEQWIADLRSKAKIEILLKFESELTYDKPVEVKVDEEKSDTLSDAEVKKLEKK